MFKNIDLFPNKPECSLSAYVHEEDNALRPRVLVRDTCTDVWESSCASGTCAVAAALSLQQNAPLELELFQPGGNLTASAIVEDGKLVALTLDGPVTFPKSGILTL